MREREDDRQAVVDKLTEPENDFLISTTTTTHFLYLLATTSTLYIRDLDELNLALVVWF